MSNSNRLWRTAEILRERGLAKRIQEDLRGKVCVAGAYSIAMTGMAYSNVFYTPDGVEAANLLDTVAKELFPARATTVYQKEWQQVVAFNNHPDSTLDEVVKVVENAAIRLDALVPA